MTQTPTALAEGFAPADREAWLALARRALKDAPIQSLASPAQDGIVVQPLYASDQAVAPLPFDPSPRGLSRPWDIRVGVRHPGLAQANSEIREALEGGADSALVVLDPSAARGVAAGCAEDLAAVLEGVLTDIAPVALDAGFLGLAAADWLARAAKASPIAPLAFHLDPIGALALSGASPGPIEAHVRACAKAAASLAVTHPRASLFLASGVVLHEAGAGSASEVAFAAASALAYARALEGAGMAPDQALPRIVLGLAADGDPLISIAKLRAVRMLWRRIATACAAPPRAVVEVRSSRRMLARADPWTNLVRLTAAGFAAGVGGGDAVVLGAFTDAIGLPAALARRLSRNIGLILIEEAHLSAVADPAGGAWAFEALSADIARAAWEKLQALEAAGGAAAGLSNGLVAGWAEEGRADLAARIASGAQKIVGVTDFRRGEGHPVEIESAQARPVAAPDPRLPGPDSLCPPLVPILVEDLASG